MRDSFRKKLRGLSILDLSDPNMDKVDARQGEKAFKKLVHEIIYKVTVSHTKPEETVIS